MVAPRSTSTGPARALDRRVPDALRLAAELTGVALLALFLIGFVQRNVHAQGDLKTYQLAARAALAGLDPYRPEHLAALAGRTVFPFVYPPVGLLPFLAVAGVPAQAFAAAWMWGKLALLGVLVFAWVRWFTRGVPPLAMALVAVFGWNASAQWDLSAGNVAILECALVWAALGCFLAGRRTGFAALIVVAACFKLAPAALLLLLLAPTERGAASPRLFAASLALLALAVLGPTLVGPAAHYESFWAHVPGATDNARANPSALGLATLLARSAGFADPAAGMVAKIAWGGYVLALGAVSLPLLRRVHRRRDARLWIMCAVFLYVLALPRPMAYGFVMLTPAPFFFSPRPFDRPAGRLLLALVLAAQGLWRLTSIASDSPLVLYAPLLLTLCVWLLVVSAPAGVAPASEEVSGSARLAA